MSARKRLRPSAKPTLRNLLVEEEAKLANWHKKKPKW
ncbi:hypothetical protein AB7M42_005407 [Bradyrhizobium diazoefficiens]|jgi:hypothetical protein|nr:hypothetical protein [Bradyrhizobium japonicum]